MKWSAHDDNDDTLAYDVYYRGDGETRWKLLRGNVAERFLNLDSDIFPDGGYTIRVVASDAPSHSAEDALTGEATSAHFEVDNTPPQIESLHAKADGGKIHVTFRAVDSFSPISHAEYSIDAGEAQTIEPVGQISDSRSESYEFTVPAPQDEAHAPSATTAKSSVQAATSDEHTIIVRVYDRFDNMGVGKVVVTAPARR